MSQLQVLTCLMGWDGPYFPRGTAELNRLYNETAVLHPPKIEEVNTYLSNPVISLKDIYAMDMRHQATHSTRSGAEAKSVSIKTDDNYAWLAGLNWNIADSEYMVLFPGFNDRETQGGLMLDRSIAFYTKGATWMERQRQLAGHLLAIFGKLSQDIWYEHYVTQIPAEGKNRIVIELPNDHPSEPPYRRAAMAIRNLIGHPPRPIGMFAGKTSHMLLLATDDEFNTLRQAKFKVCIV